MTRRGRFAPLAAIALTVGLHALVLDWALRLPSSSPGLLQRADEAPEIVWLRTTPPEAPPSLSPAPPAPRQARPADPVMMAQAPAPTAPASMAAPPAPSAEEWAFASRYTLKNSKAYRHTWGRQVRSMMGTAVEGPEQGMVRFRVEIAPDGSLARLDTLWSTSQTAERLARRAVESMPRWPPTPTGQPLVFEKTIAFTPFATDDPPLYKDDCLPDPPAFSNPFAWDGRSAREPARPAQAAKPDAAALADCLRQLPPDSIEAESARDRRLMEQWGSVPGGR